MQAVRLLLILSAVLLLAGAETRLGETPSALADAELVTQHARVQALSFDGLGTVNPPVIKQDSSFSTFSENVNAFDDLNDERSAEGDGTQDTTVTVTDQLLSSVETSGTAQASWTDGDAGDGDDPRGEGASELTITFEVTNQSAMFSLSGSIEATGSATNDSCTTVTVTSPDGTTFEVAAPAGCGSPQQDVDDSGQLAMGTYTFSVDAKAVAANPNALGGTAEASFNLTLSLGVIHSVEFTQGTQELQTVGDLKADLEGDGTPPVPIVAGKPAVMRVYFGEVQETAVYEVEATGDVSGSRFVQLAPGCTPAQRRSGENAFCTSLDFAFMPPAGDWSTTLKVRRQQDSQVLEELEFNLTSVETVPLVLKPVTVCDHVDPNTGLWNCGSLFNFVNLLPFLRATFPGEVVVAGASSTVYVDTGEIPANGDWWNLVTDRVKALWTADGAIEDLYEYGVVRPEADAGTTGGLAYDRANASAGRTSLLRDDMDGGLPQQTAHELVAHLLGLSMGLKDRVPSSGGCYGQPADPDQHWPNGSSPEIGEVGFDIAEEEPIPDTHADVMSLCTPRWISPYTANHMIDRFLLLSAAVATTGLTQGEFWLVSGLLDLGAGETEFDPLFQLETEGSMEAGSGPYTIEVRDGSDAVLFTRLFRVDDVRREDEGAEQAAEANIGRFAELVPVQAGAAKIVVLSEDDPVGEIVLGGATPVVQLTSGVASAALPAGVPPLPVFSWSVQDGDSSAHSFWLELSRDGGATWTTIAPRFARNTLSIDPALVGGGTGLLLRVLASDGANTGIGVSDPFDVAEQTPQGAIIAPVSGLAHRTGNLVWLQAAAIDPEDGSLDTSAVQWSSSKDGPLGTGASLPVFDLTGGTHTITMTAKDSDNNTVTDTITITVLDGPIVEAGAVADIDCDAEVGVLDALALLSHLAGLDAGSCQTIGEGEPIAFGDADCDGSIGVGDVTAVLALLADLPAGCA